MTNIIYITILTIAAAVGFYAAGFVPVYGQPFVGCEGQTILSLNPHCGYWPECLRYVLLVAPTAIFIRKTGLLVGYVVAVLVLACLGGLPSVMFGDHSIVFSEPIVAVYNNLYFNLIPALCAVVVLCVGYALNRYIINLTGRSHS